MERIYKSLGGSLIYSQISPPSHEKFKKMSVLNILEMLCSDNLDIFSNIPQMNLNA